MKSYQVLVESITQEQISNLNSLGLNVKDKQNKLEIDALNNISGNDILKMLLNENLQIIKFEEYRYNLERVYIEVTENESSNRND